MRGRKLTPLGVIAKWLAVPALCGALGFYVIGPRVTQVAPRLADRVAEATDGSKKQSYTAPDIAVDSVPAARYNPAPGVEISAKERRPRRRRRRTNPVVLQPETGREPAETYAAPASKKPAVTSPDGV